MCVIMAGHQVWVAGVDLGSCDTLLKSFILALRVLLHVCMGLHWLWPYGSLLVLLQAQFHSTQVLSSPPDRHSVVDGGVACSGDAGGVRPPDADDQAAVGGGAGVEHDPVMANQLPRLHIR